MSVQPQLGYGFFAGVLATLVVELAVPSTISFVGRPVLVKSVSHIHVPNEKGVVEQHFTVNVSNEGLHPVEGIRITASIPSGSTIDGSIGVPDPSYASELKRYPNTFSLTYKYINADKNCNFDFFVTKQDREITDGEVNVTATTLGGEAITKEEFWSNVTKIGLLLFFFLVLGGGTAIMTAATYLWTVRLAYE